MASQSGTGHHGHKHAEEPYIHTSPTAHGEEGSKRPETKSETRTEPHKPEQSSTAKSAGHEQGNRVPQSPGSESEMKNREHRDKHGKTHHDAHAPTQNKEPGQRKESEQEKLRKAS